MDEEIILLQNIMFSFICMILIGIIGYCAWVYKNRPSPDKFIKNHILLFKQTDEQEMENKSKQEKAKPQESLSQQVSGHQDKPKDEVVKRSFLPPSLLPYGYRHRTVNDPQPYDLYLSISEPTVSGSTKDQNTPETTSTAPADPISSKISQTAKKLYLESEQQEQAKKEKEKKEREEQDKKLEAERQEREARKEKEEKEKAEASKRKTTFAQPKSAPSTGVKSTSLTKSNSISNNK